MRLEPKQNAAGPFGQVYKSHQEIPVSSKDNRTDHAGKRPAKTLALLSTILFAACPCLEGAEARPLPPPPELLNTQGYAIDAPAPRPNAAPNVYQQPRSPTFSPEEMERTLAPSQPYQVAGNPNSAPSAPYSPAVPPQTPNQFAQGQPRPRVTISPPARNMPDDYFNLPLVEEGIPGVIMPEFDEDFVDPGMAQVRGRRRITQGLSLDQLQPYFDQAKGSERAALEAKKYGDSFLYRKNLDRAVEQYAKVIAMADATTEAREEAWYGMARCEYRRENWWRAFDALERSFPSKYDREEVAGRIRLEMFIGERLWRMGHAPVPDARKDGTTMPGYQAASRVYTAALLNNPGAKDAPLALLRRGDAAAMEEDWQEAAKFYRSVVQHYPESEPAMQARSSLTEAIYRQYPEETVPVPEPGREEQFKSMVEVETAERKLSKEAEERRQRAVALGNQDEASTKLRQAKEYMSNVRVKKSRDAAVFLLGQVVSFYPNTPQAQEASELLLGMGIDPPMTVSDGTRFPQTSGWVAAYEEAIDEANVGGGSVQVGRQSDTRTQTQSGNAPYSPARPPLQESTRPVDVQVPGISPDM